MTINIFAHNYRGFRDLKVDLEKNIILVGDNSSGKSSILHLINFVLGTELEREPELDERFAFDKNDFFSPYFNNSDVTIGYISGDGAERVSKIVTLHKRKFILPPMVSRITIAAQGLRMTFSLRSGKIYYKKNSISEDFDCFDLLKMHSEGAGFKGSIDIKPDLRLNQAINLFEALRSLDEDKEEMQIVLRLFARATLPYVSQMGPVRGLPERYYEYDRTYKVSGSHFASMWHDLESEFSKYSEILEKFGKESGLFDQIRVVKISKKMDASPFVVYINKNGKEFLISQMGIGVSQVIPIIIESVFTLLSESDTVLLLQQPELHLHPIAQAALGEFFYEMSIRGAKYVIETHSDFLIDRYRAKMREEVDKAKFKRPISILYCQKKEDGNHYQEVEVNNDGELVDPPEDYKKFFIKETIRTMF